MLVGSDDYLKLLAMTAALLPYITGIMSIIELRMSNFAELQLVRCLIKIVDKRTE